ncbi:MAG: hypothetical protein D6736_11920, partial [Nitrospinota bacterium]
MEVRKRAVTGVRSQGYALEDRSSAIRSPPLLPFLSLGEGWGLYLYHLKETVRINGVTLGTGISVSVEYQFYYLCLSCHVW